MVKREPPEKLSDMERFRNTSVNEYWKVDSTKVHETVMEDLVDVGGVCREKFLKFEL